jgi:succinate dehydrogenase flavin-adding protein (antitoxin of CptAB toxin-antitoxin module)
MTNLMPKLARRRRRSFEAQCAAAEAELLARGFTSEKIKSMSSEALDKLIDLMSADALQRDRED